MNIIKKAFQDEIARRYFVMNTFDGILSGIGILIAFLISGIYDSQVIILSCFGSSIAMGISGIWGTYLIERAERTHKAIKDNLKKTKELHNENIKKSIIAALIDGLSPFLAIFLLILPFFLISAQNAFIISFAIAGILIILLGVFIAKIGRQRIIISILKLLSAALTVIAIIYFMETLNII